VEWALQSGATVKAGDLLLTVETAKAATEIEAPCDGVLSAIMAEPGAEVSLDEVIGLIGATAEDTSFEAAAAEHEAEAEVATAAVTPEGTTKLAQEGRVVASPAARREAARLGVDLSSIAATSPSGRIKLRDLAGASSATSDNDFTDAAHSAASVTLPNDQAGPLKVFRSGPESGETVVMLHGFAADALTWHLLEPVLASARQIVRIELPNHGQSPKRRMGSFRNLSREIVAAFDALDFEKAHIVGHSLGGACALALADVRPQKVASLALLAPAGLGPEMDGVFAEGLARASRPESLAQWLKRAVADPQIISADFAKAAMDARADPAMRAAQLQMTRDLFPDGTQGFDLRPALGRVLAPTRIVWGRSDAILPWQQALSAPGRVGLHFFDAVGHLLQFERTEEVLSILQDLFQTGKGRGPVK